MSVLREDSIQGRMVAAAVAGSRKTRGSCDETVSRTLRFAELRLAKESRRWQYRRCAAQAEKTELRGLLLPEEPPLRARARRALRDVSAQPARGAGAAEAARAADAAAAVGVVSGTSADRLSAAGPVAVLVPPSLRGRLRRLLGTVPQNGATRRE